MIYSRYHDFYGQKKKEEERLAELAKLKEQKVAQAKADKAAKAKATREKNKLKEAALEKDVS